MKKQKTKNAGAKAIGNRTVIGIVCIVAALAICFGIAPLVNRLNDGKTEIVRICQTVIKGSQIGEGDVETVKVGAYNLPAGVLTKKEDVVGKYATGDLYPGEYILPARITSDVNTASDILEGLGSTQKAISLTIGSFAQGLSGKLETGDIISVIVFSQKDGFAFTPGELQYIRVITSTTSQGVDKADRTDNTQPVTVTLLVNQEQAELLAQYEKSASMHFALEYRGDAATAQKYLDRQGHLPGNTRITAIKSPVVDEEAGISVSIRLLHPQRVDRKHIIEGGMATEEMIAFLEMCIRYGVSVVIAGRTSSGKTTLMNALLSSIPDDKRIYTIESGARELFLVKKNRFGDTLNNVVHTLSRPSESSAYNISQEDLVVAALRFDPDVVVVGEIRDAEANSAVEASLTGHTVVTTVHSGPAESAHGRISLLCQRRFQLGMAVSLSQSRQAFPVVVFAHKCEDNSRKVMDITECEVTPDGKTCYRCLYRYNIRENNYENGKFHITGEFEKVNSPSEYLRTLLTRSGVPLELLNQF